MAAQDELKQLFKELDNRTDRALEGLAAVREGNQAVRLRPSVLVSACQVGFLSLLIFMVAELMRRGSQPL